jgi:hypothetical protein
LPVILLTWLMARILPPIDVPAHVIAYAAIAASG